MVRFSFTVLLACALALQIAAAPHVQAAPYTPPDISVQIDAYLNRAAMAGSFSGSVLVARRGHILLDKGYGQADRAARIPDTPQTRYLLASVSKQFTAMAILLLQKEGKLNVRDRICNYLATCPRTWRAITIHELLAHTSGIPDYMSFADFDAGMNTAITPAELVDRFRYLPLDFAPGTSWRYSNSGYALLGYIIERVSGQSYSDFLQRRIFHPLRMSATAYEPDGVIGEGTAVGYDGQSKADAMNPTVAYAAGGLVSTVEDLYRWSLAINDSRLLPANLTALMQQPQARIPGRNAGSYGYGWFIREHMGMQAIEHTGVLNGFTTLIAHFPRDDITLIVLCNQGVDMDDIESNLLQLLTKRRARGE